MAGEIDRLKVAVEMDVSDLKKGLRDTQTAVNGAVKELHQLDTAATNSAVSAKELSTSTQGIDREFQSISESADEASDGLNTLAESGNSVSESMDGIKESAKGASDEVENMNESTKKSCDEFGALDGVIGKVKDALGVVGIVGTMIGTIHKMIELQDETIKTSNYFQALYGDVTDAARALDTYNYSKNKLRGAKDEVKAAVGEAVSREFKDMNLSVRTDIAQEFINTGNAMGTDSENLVYTITEIMDKWDISQDKTIELLQKLLNVSQEQKGDYRQNFRENLGALSSTEYRTMYQSRGMGIDEVLQLFTGFGSQRISAMEGSASLYGKFTSDLSDISQASTDLVKLESDRESANDKIMSIWSKASEDLSQGKNISESTKTQVEKLQGEIRSIDENIKTLTELSQKTPEDVAKGLTNISELSPSQFRSPTDYENFVNAALLLNQTGQYPLKDVSGNVSIPYESIQEQISKGVGGLIGRVGEIIFPTPETLERDKLLKDAQQRNLDAMNNLLGAAGFNPGMYNNLNATERYNFSNGLVKQRQAYTEFTRPEGYDSSSFESVNDWTGRIEKLTESIKELKNQNIVVQVNVTTDNSYTKVNADAKRYAGDASSLRVII